MYDGCKVSYAHMLKSCRIAHENVTSLLSHTLRFSSGWRCCLPWYPNSGKFTLKVRMGVLILADGGPGLYHPASLSVAFNGASTPSMKAASARSPCREMHRSMAVRCKCCHVVHLTRAVMPQAFSASKFQTAKSSGVASRGRYKTRPCGRYKRMQST